MAKILVTGGTGYIGSHTVVELLQNGNEVIIVDNLSNSNVQVLEGIYNITGIKPTFENVDCTDYVQMERVLNKYPNIDAVIHFAASKAVAESVEKPLMYYRNNLLSLINLLELMLNYKISNIVFSSSCTVYGQPDNLPVDETAPIKKAESPYGNTKQIAEEIITDLTATNKQIKAVILRYFNPIGAHPRALIGEIPNGVPNNLMPYITQTAAGKRTELKIYGNDYNTPDGTCIRDYIDVVDLAKAHLAALTHLLNNKQEKQVEVFNVGTGRGLSVLEILTTFQEVNKLKVPHKIVARRKGDIEQVWADPTYANTTLQWKALTPLTETLKNAWKWEQNQKK